MKKLLVFFTLLIIVASCSKDETADPIAENSDAKQQMRDFVINISNYSKNINPDFAIIPQNGIELITENGSADGIANYPYLNAIDGNGQEDLNYGYDNDNEVTPTTTTGYLKQFLDIAKDNGKKILAIDYCSTESKMLNSYILNEQNDYISFAANHRILDNIPTIPNPIQGENNAVVTSISQAKNFLYLINPENYSSKAAFISAVAATNYDMLVMDLFFKDNSAFSKSEIAQLKQKSNGGQRIVICYMSIGEAEDYRYYWNSSWNANPPQWLDKENPDWKGNFKVKYWNTDWQKIIYDNDSSYLKKILDAGFDGVYLDIIDAFEYYEK